MFTHIDSSQYVADRITNFVLAADVCKSTRDLMLRTIQEFEGLSWQPLAFEDALKAAPTLVIDENVTIRTGEDIEGAMLAIDAILRKYAELMHSHNAKLAAILMAGREYTAPEAAEYLKMTRETFNKYATRLNQISGRKVGTSILYSKAELDRFKAIYEAMPRSTSTKSKPRTEE